MAMPSTDSDELAKFGYKQELDRSLGLFSSFAAGFSYISIMTGVFELFFFGFASGGPGWIWTWPAVLAGQMLVALCFAELAGQFPLAGSVYQWSKQIARPFTSWFGGWILTVGSIVTLAAVAVAYQVVLPQISARFQIIGGPSDIGLTTTPDGAKNALLLAAGLVVFTTVINMVGVKTMARINNFGVAAELVGVTLLIILLAVHITRGPGIVFHTFGTGAGHTFGYFGALLVALLTGAYVLYGFDTAGSLAEETHDPRRHAPPAIIRALAAAGLAGFLVIVLAEMAVPNIHAPEIATSGLPYIVKATFGGSVGNRPGARQVQDAADPVDRDRHPHHRAAGAERRQPARVLRAHLGRDHHVLHGLYVRHRAAADRPGAQQVADAHPRPLLLAGPLGTTGEHPGRRLPDDHHDQPGVAAGPGLRQRPVVLPVGSVRLRRPPRRRGCRLLPGRAARTPGRGPSRAPRRR